MLNEYIIEVNILVRKMLNATEEERVTLTEKFNDSLSSALKFISENNVPVDTVITIEDRLVRDLLLKEKEESIRQETERAKSEYERLQKETDFLARGVNSGMGGAQLKYLDAKARMDDFQSESAHMTKEDRIKHIETFNKLYSEYLSAKREYKRVGKSDANALPEALKTSAQSLKNAEANYEECRKRLKRLPLKPSEVEYVSGSGAVSRVLKGTFSPPAPTVEQPAPTAQPIAQPIAPIVGDEVAKTRNEALNELALLRKEIADLRTETAALKGYIEQAKAAITTIEKARQAATVSAKRAIAIAERIDKK